MITYEDLLKEADDNNLITKEKALIANKGRIKGNLIAVQKGLTETEKKCVLAEELGHHFTSSGDILNLSDTANRKQEHLARMWAYNNQIGLHGLIKAFERGCQNRYEIAEYLDVTEEFLQECINCYGAKYGLCTVVNNFIVFFEPLGVMELLEPHQNVADR